jgi:hypothetical protein
MHGFPPPAACQAAEAQARWTAAMRAGDFATAWAIGDAVLAASDPAARDDPLLPYHLRRVWDATPPDGRDVLVRCYHGLGDVLMAARLLPMLRARARTVVLETPPPLHPLLAGMADRLIPFDPTSPAMPSGCDIELMEVAQVLRLRADAVPRPPYLPMPVPMPVTLRLARRPALGLCWRAGEWDAERSVPLDDLRSAVGGAVLVSLQRGPAAVEARGPGFANPGDCSGDVGRTAALIAGVDLVVTVDTMVAHLAGALGAPCCVLLKAAADWRWGEPGGRSLWYPALRLYRQERAGDWRAPLTALARDLGSGTAFKAPARPGAWPWRPARHGW